LNVRDLYPRWERQHWLVEDVELGPDRDDWASRLPRTLRDRLRVVVQTFIIGEYTGLELLGPILSSCPDEDDLVFLGTQVADESRHTVLMKRLAEEVLGMGSGLPTLLPQAWNELPPAYRRISVLESDLIRELATNPRDYGTWLRAVALFHLVTEGMLALDGQRSLVHALGHVSFLQGMKAGFTAMIRDESRHMSYGMHALRRGLAEGYSDEICGVLEQVLPAAIHIDVPGRAEVSDLTDGTARWAAAERTARRMREIVRRRLSELNLPPVFIDYMLRRSIDVPKWPGVAAGSDGTQPGVRGIEFSLRRTRPISTSATIVLPSGPRRVQPWCLASAST
jgi:hypothetical protein